MSVVTEAAAVAVGVLGTGTMGSGIAWLFARAGHPVRVCDVDSAAARAGLERLESRLRDARAAGALDHDLAHLDAIEVRDDVEGVAHDSRLVIEAVSEDAAVKADVLTRLSAAADPMAVLASNTSSLLISGLARSVARPERFVGIHFFNPADAIPGVEVIPHADTDPAVVASVMTMLSAVGKDPAVAADAPGFIANRLQFALFHEALRCVDEGIATVEDIDTIVRSTFGFRLAAYGPFRIADMAGLDVYRSILGVLSEGIGAPFTIPDSLERMVERGDLGVKSGTGYGDHGDGRGAALLEERDARYRAILAAVRSVQS